MKQSKLLISLLLAITALPFSFAQGKKSLDHDIYDSWRSIKGSDLSRDGKWFGYSVGPAVGDAEAFIVANGGTSQFKIERGGSPRFTPDSKFAFVTVVPAKADVDKAKKEKKKPADMPKNSLAIVALPSGETVYIERLQSFATSTDGSRFLVYKVEAAAPAPGSSAATGPKPEGKPKTEQSEPQKKKEHAVGSELFVRDLTTGKDRKISDVTDYSFSKNGDVLVYVKSSKTGAEDGVYWLDLVNDKTIPLMVGLGVYRSLTIHEKSNAVAFTTDRNDYKSEKPLFEVFVCPAGSSNAKRVAKSGDKGIPDGWIVSSRGLRFSDSGRRLFIATSPKPPEDKKDDTPDDEKVSVDVWNWQDPELQPMQLLRASQNRDRTFQAVVDLRSGTITQLESDENPSVTVGSKGDADFGLSWNNKPYRQLVSWDDEYGDASIVSISDGKMKPLLIKSPDRPSQSPSGKFAVWYSSSAKEYRCAEVRSGRTVSLSAGVPHALWDESDDHPASPPPYGFGGWTKGDERAIVYDKFDVWLCDPTGKAKPECWTRGIGRLRGVVFRPIQLDSEADSRDLSDPAYFTTTDDRTHYDGFFRLEPNGEMKKLVMAPKKFGSLQKAKDAEVYQVTREDAIEYRDIWIGGPNLNDLKKMTDANPQQKEYNWCTKELVSWTSLDGQKLEGLLIKPENFDPAKKYPMVVYFYERHSQDLYTYVPPTPSASTINPTFFASRGYIVFMPDIPYIVGHPGQSAVKAILPGVTSLVERGYIDPKRIGMQGQSWGGYQVAYLATQTDMFRCAGAGAAVSNMFSAYGGIRWGSGMVRQFQYEKGQSRIGGTMWEKPLLYIENSPIFWVDRIQTPLLLMNNDADDAVPWYQGIEFFTALRRFGKPVWMLVYNGEGHNIMKRHNRKDFSVRQQQFFDHYLMGAPAPVWMTEGIPATQKGKTMGLEIKPGK